MNNDQISDVVLWDELQQRREQVDSLQQLLDECCVEIGNYCSWKDLPEKIRLLKSALKVQTEFIQERLSGK